MNTRADYANAVLLGLTGQKLSLYFLWGARRALVATMIAESGNEPCNGVFEHGAKFNPLDTTLPMPGSTNYNSVPVQNYPTWAEGVAACVSTLNESRYTVLKGALVKPFNSSSAVLLAWGASQWGTPTTLLLEAFQTWSGNKTYWNDLTVG